MDNKFIRLHNTDNNSVVIINTDLIAVIDTDEVENYGKGTKICSKIYMNKESEMDCFTVNETPEKIFEMITSK